MRAAVKATAEIRLLLVDDHPVLRAGVIAVLSAETDFHVVGEASDGATGIALALELNPSVVVMDVSLPGLGGAEATRRLTRERPDIAVLAYSVHEEVQFARSLLDAGARGYALKRGSSEELLRAIRIVAAGDTYVDPTLAGKLLPARARRPTSAAGGLSEREEEVLRFIAQGLTIREIAERLGLSPRTLETYRARAMDKLTLKTRADLIRHALNQGWLSSSR